MCSRIPLLFPRGYLLRRRALNLSSRQKYTREIRRADTLRARMSPFELFATLTTLAALFSWLNHRLLRLPTTIGLMALYWVLFSVGERAEWEKRQSDAKETT